VLLPPLVLAADCKRTEKDCPATFAKGGAGEAALIVEVSADRDHGQLFATPCNAHSALHADLLTLLIVLARDGGMRLQCEGCDAWCHAQVWQRAEAEMRPTGTYGSLPWIP